jgi:hypothetical protein
VLTFATIGEAATELALLIVPAAPALSKMFDSGTPP